MASRKRRRSEVAEADSGDHQRGQEGLSKKQIAKRRRKQQRAAAKRQEQVNRQAIYESLERNRLPDEGKALLKSTASLGKRETARQSLRRALNRERLGLPVPKESKLVEEREVSEGEDEEGQDEREDHGTANLSERKPPVQLPARTKQKGWEEEEEGVTHRVADSMREQVKSLDPSLLSEHVMAFNPDNRAHAKLAELQKKLTHADANQRSHSAEHEAKEAPRRAKMQQFVVRVNRRKEVQDAREGLPIIGMEQEIMEAVSQNDMSIICGATGCGKTTQVPQFLYEAGYGHPDAPNPSGAIAVTQPRRVAVTSTARRVSDELNVKLGHTVGYQVRYDKVLSKETLLKFMTDGILLRELQEDLLLRKYGVIIVDEAHERSVNTDILLGILSRVVPLRRKMAEQGAALEGEEGVKPLKLIIMSATLRVQDFRENERLCPSPPPLIQVPTRQYPVTVHFAKRTEMHDYVSAAYKKVSAIHRKLPKGDVLVFLTGQKEVQDLCKRLTRTFGKPAGGEAEEKGNERDGKSEQSSREKEEEDEYGIDAFDIDEADAFGEEQGEEDYSESDSDVSDDDVEEDEQVQFVQERMRDIPQVESTSKSEGGEQDESNKEKTGPTFTRALPLFAMLPAEEQAKVFEEHPEDERLIVVATNVAETSITIPGVRYVVDCGRAKKRIYESGSGLSRFRVDWISKSSAEQRAGRAGRTGPGHCYRLYSSALFNEDFLDYEEPAISNVPIEGTVLQMKAMGIENVVNFPFPTPPSREALAEAEKTLITLGAIDEETKLLQSLGRAMSGFPVSPRHSRMLLEALSLSTSHDAVFKGAVALTAALSLDNPFLSENDSSKEDNRASREKRAMNGASEDLKSSNSDALTVVNALREYEGALSSFGPKGVDRFCKSRRLHNKTLREMMDLRQQIANMLETGKARLPRAASMALKKAEEAGADMNLSGGIPELDRRIESQLRKAVCAGWCDRIARRVSSTEAVRQAAGKALRYTPCIGEEPVYLHPSSALHATAPSLVAYTEVVQTAKRPYMTSATAAAAEWLPSFAPRLCKESSALADPPPRYVPERDEVRSMHTVTYGDHGWELPLVERPVQDMEQAVPLFAHALLEGSAVEGMSELKPGLVSPPRTVAKAAAQGNRRVAELIQALKDRNIACRDALAREWATNTGFLKRELKLWYRRPEAVEAKWPIITRAQRPGSLASSSKRRKQ